jgi:hypothetical protein
MKDTSVRPFCTEVSILTTVIPTMPWWYRASARRALESWIRPLIAERPYTLRYEVTGRSYMDFSAREIVIDPTAWDFLGIAKRLPISWNGKRIDTPAKLQWRFARTGARHEAMHVLFSVPPDCSGTLHFLVNVLEDEWMEQLARFFYPSAWGDFVARCRLAAQYYPLPDPRLCSRESLLLNMCLFHRFDWKRSKGVPSRYRFQAEEDAQFWQEQIRPLVEKAWQTHDAAARKEIARQILDLLGIPEEAPLPKDALMMSAAILDVEGERDEDDEPMLIAQMMVGSSSSSSSADGSVEAKARDGAAGSSLEHEGSEVGKDGGKGSEGGSSGDDGEPRGSSSVSTSTTGGGVDESGELPYAALVHLVSDDDEVPPPLSAASELYLLPPAYLESLVRGEKNRLLRVLLAHTLDAGEDASPVGSEFDVESYLRSDGARPFRLPDDEAPEHEGLAIAMLIDTTGSMKGWKGTGGIDAHGVFLPAFYDPRHRMTYARQVAMLFELVCPPAGITLLIGAAGDRGELIHLATADKWGTVSFPSRYKPDQPVTWLRTRQTPSTSEVTRAAIAGLYGKYGCERVSPALLEAERELLACGAGTKVILYIHDGLPTDEQPETIMAVLGRIRRKGMLVFAPYVGDQSNIGKLLAIFGMPWTIPVEQLSDLSKRLGRLLLRYAQH